MSASDPMKRGKSKLIVRSAVGVGIEILDADYSLSASGNGVVSTTLPDGIYIVNVSSGGHTSQTLVRLPGTTNPMELEVPLPRPSGPIGLLRSYSDREAKGSSPATKGLRPSEIARGSEVLIIIRDKANEGELRRSLRLFDASLRAMRSDSDLDAEQELGIAARQYSVDPGEYRLQFLSLTGERIHQSVPALPGRRTVVLMRSGPAVMLRPEGNEFKRIKTNGVDAARTVIITTALHEPLEEQSEPVRIAELLLSHLSKDPGSLSADVIDLLERPSCDPLMLVYGAACLIASAEGRSFHPSSCSKPSSSLAKSFRQAARWLDRAARKGIRADVAAARWRVGPEIAGPAKATKLSSPPMLDIAWRWAAAHSVNDPRAVPQSIGFQGAIWGQGASGPWLTWSAAAAKGGPTKAKQPSKLRLQELIRTNAVKIDEIFRSHSFGSGELPIGSFTPMARLTSAAYTEWKARKRKRPSPAEVLAARCAAPAPELERRLEQLQAQLAAAGAVGGELRPASVSGTTLSKEKAPGLRRLVRHPDDPHKERFGGLPHVHGFAIEASFPKPSGKEWAPVKLSISAPSEANGELAHFYLHDSFEPDKYTVRFAKGKAGLSIRTWGGFTVGVWIPRFSIELELDLALIPGAPRIVRER